MAWLNDMLFLFLLHELLFISHFCCILYFSQTSLASITLSVFQTTRTVAVPLRIHSETMGGRAIRREPQVLTVFTAAREILARERWLTYLNRLQESNETMAIEFLQNLQEDYSIARGRQITVTDDIIAEVSGLPATGPVWTLKNERLQKIIEIFQDKG